MKGESWPVTRRGYMYYVVLVLLVNLALNRLPKKVQSLVVKYYRTLYWRY